LGRLVVTGWVTHLEGEAAEGRLAAVRLLADGQVDVSYGQAGALLVGIEGRKAYSEASPLIDDVGRLVIAGWTQNHVSPFDERFLVVRLLDSGQVDPAFGASGVAVTDFGAGPDYAASSALDAAGRIVLVGKAVLSAIGLSRYVP
jgi:hypothetical protein